MIKNYNEFISESIRGKMKPKSDEEIRDAMKNMTMYQIFTNFSYGQIPKEYLPAKKEILEKLPLKTYLEYFKDGTIPNEEEYKLTKEEIENDIDFQNLDAIDKVNIIKTYELDKSLLPSDKEIDENIEETFKEIHGISIEETKKLIEELKKLGVDASLQIVKDKILEPGNRYFLNTPIRVYYYQIQNGNHVILNVLTKKGAEKIVEEIKKYGLNLSQIIINEPSGYFDSTTITVKDVIKLKNDLKNEKI